MATSANMDFFAAELDQRSVLEFLFSSTNVRVFESYSEFDTDLREFKSVDQVADVMPLGTDPIGNGNALLLQLWSPTVMRDLAIVKFSVDPIACDGHRFRYRIDGGGLMQLYLGGVSGQVITKSHFGHQSEVRAQKWSVADGVDWDALKVLSNQFQYHMRKRLSVGKAGSCLVLPRAMELARSGYSLKLAVQTPWSYELRTSKIKA